MRSFVVPLGLVCSFAVTQGAHAQSTSPAPATGADPHWSLSLERFASANALFVSLDDGDDEVKLRSKGITVGGPINNPLSAPRLAFDYLSKSGLTVGAGLAFGLGDLDGKEGDKERDEGGYNLLMLAPRIGYRVALTDWLDLTPRVGMTMGWASIIAGEEENCDYDWDPDTGQETRTCYGDDPDRVNLFAALTNLELAATFRLTESFNVITGVSYDMVVAAKAEEEEGGSGDTEGEKLKDGHLSSLQLWLGLGGYF